MNRRTLIFSILAAVILVSGVANLKQNDKNGEQVSAYDENKAIALAMLEPTAGDATAPVLNPEQEDHILQNHLAGKGIPCKSEFPAAWDEDHVVQTVQLLAANDNADWRVEGNGYRVSEQMSDGVEVRVVVDASNNEIITAYPLNVTRNPCEAPANDNSPQ